MSNKPKKDMDIARKVWLAGIGAYGRAVGDAQEAYAKVGKGTSKVFEDLVGKGEQLESMVSEAAMQYVPKVSEKHRTNIEDRMERMKVALGMAESAADQSENIGKIEERLDAIESKVDAILATLKPKATAPRARKTPAKKAPAKKTPAKKTTSRSAPK